MNVYKLVNNKKRIGIFTGAGISTSCGIPDFRGEGGLYSFAKEKYNLPYPEAIFDLEYFKKYPKPFFLLTRDFLNESVTPSFSHEYIADMEKRGVIELVVTQNIDMLHEKAGSRNVINCHGSYTSATCRNCLKKYSFEDIEASLKSGEVSKCSCGGVIKPDITFFGETLPRKFYELLENPPELDLIIVVGTTLTVEPAASFPKHYLGRCPTILVNRDETPYDSYFDYVVRDSIDDFFKGVRDWK